MQSLLAEADAFWAYAVDLAWGLPMAVLLIGAGLTFTILGRLAPLFRIRHAIEILRGRFDDESAPGQITHFQALSSALSATLGMGNIAGVAIAVTTGGPGAVFWMWIAGLVGMATKFFTCTLAVLHRKVDANGVPQGGPMYWIEVGLGRRWRFLGIMFASFGMLGCLALFQVNQLASIIADSLPLGEFDLLGGRIDITKLLTGVAAAVVVGIVILGGIVRVGQVAAKVVPIMAILYFVSALVIIVQHAAEVPGVLAAIITSAFGGEAMVGGAAGVTMKQALITGVRRAAFSNEAGMGTAPLVHGAARTNEPVREGLVAMLGPFIDTNIVCTLTALVILTTGVSGDSDGVLLTARAFEAGMPSFGRAILTLVIVLFSVSTLISYAYYGRKCAIYVLGERWGARYQYVYIGSILLGATWTQSLVINMLDTAFAMMAIPTVLSALLLAPHVTRATRDYFQRMEAQSSR